jgi:hypothetical protein
VFTYLVSFVIGAAAGGVFAKAIYGTRGRVRARRGFAVGLPLLVVLGVWAFWTGAFPATFVPFVIICFGVTFFDGDRNVKKS